MEQARNPNLFTLLTVTLISFIAIGYGITALNTGNWFWFLADTDLGNPIRIVITDHGEKTVITPEDIRFESLANAIGESVVNVSNNDLIAIGLSDLTLEDYASKSVIMEVHYPRPISFNTPFRAGNPTELLIPIDGRHSGAGVFFRGQGGDWWFGGMRMANPLPLYTALGDIGYQNTVGDSIGNNG